MDEPNAKANPITTMPKAICDLDLDEKQLAVAQNYWRYRMDIAQRQRNVVLCLLMMVVATLLTKSLSVGDAIAPGQLEKLSDAIVAWAIPVGIGLSLVILVAMEFLVFRLNKGLAHPKLRLTPAMKTRFITIGNSVSLHILLFRRKPVRAS